MCFPKEKEEEFHSLENSNEYMLIDTVCALPLQLVLWIILSVCQQKFHATGRSIYYSSIYRLFTTVLDCIMTKSKLLGEALNKFP